MTVVVVVKVINRLEICPSSGSPLWMGPYGENARVLETKVWRQSHPDILEYRLA